MTDIPGSFSMLGDVATRIGNPSPPPPPPDVYMCLAKTQNSAFAQSDRAESLLRLDLVQQ